MARQYLREMTIISEETRKLMGETLEMATRMAASADPPVELLKENVKIIIKQRELLYLTVAAVKKAVRIQPVPNNRKIIRDVKLMLVLIRNSLKTWNLMIERKEARDLFSRQIKEKKE